MYRNVLVAAGQGEGLVTFSWDRSTYGSYHVEHTLLSHAPAILHLHHALRRLCSRQTPTVLSQVTATTSKSRTRAKNVGHSSYSNGRGLRNPQNSARPSINSAPLGVFRRAPHNVVTLASLVRFIPQPRGFLYTALHRTPRDPQNARKEGLL